MKAVLRLGMAIAAAGLWLGHAPALAQSTPAATTNTPASDAIGPAQLQNFNLQGTVTRPTDTPPETRPPATTRVAEPAQPPASRQPTAPPSRAAGAARPRAEAPAPAASATRAPPAEIPYTEAGPAAPASLPTIPVETPAELAPEQSLSLWPWLLAALALGAAGAFLFWRRSSREAYAGGPHVDEFVAPEPPPQPRVAPRAATPPQSPGFVSSRMRPWIEIGFHPLRCIVEERGVTFEFELELFNSGNAPARDILIQANAFNASPTQDQDIAAFFANIGQGERVPVIPPMQRISIRPQFGMPFDQIRVLEAGGRRVFVPLMAFSATYAWSGGAGQTGAAYLVGRNTGGEKLAPFRLDLGPRVFRGLAALPLPNPVRN